MDQYPCETRAASYFPILVVTRHYQGDEIERLNQRLEQLIKELETANRATAKTTSTQGGFHTGTNFLHRDDSAIAEFRSSVLLPGLFEYLKYFYQSMSITGETISSDKIEIRGWGNIMRRGEWNAPHNHITAHTRMSAVYYIKMPDRPFPEGVLQFDNPNQISKLHGAYGDMKFIPTAGDLVLFPCYQTHFSHPFESEAERILISADIRVRDRLDVVKDNYHHSLAVRSHPKTP